jgi:DNA methylase
MNRPKRFILPDEPRPKLTHHLFRYPAKFHAPVARGLLDAYVPTNATVLDPFCGSGSLLVEAIVSKRNAVGVDCDPVAAFVSRVKTTPISPTDLAGAWSRLSRRLAPLERCSEVYARFMFEDLSDEHVRKATTAEDLFVPSIPNLFHWFRRYVVLDLARIHAEIVRLRTRSSVRDALLLCFASIIRSASNADPVPVSGLEVTSHMLKRDAAGRLINPFDLFRAAMTRLQTGLGELHGSTTGAASVWCGDAATVSSTIKTSVDAVITSPPYHNAVDYYRRHQLEMFWLQAVSTQADRLRLLPAYIGRPKVPASHPLLHHECELPPSAVALETKMRRLSPERANAFRHYIIAMQRVFEELAAVLPPASPAVFVVGKSLWNGSQIPTPLLFRDLADPWFTLRDHLWYPLKNRYMSYARHNDASIDREFVVVLRRR